MRIAFFDAHNFERGIFLDENAGLRLGHEISFIEARLSLQTAALAKGHKAICIFAGDKIDADIARELSLQGVELVALRSAGFNHVDIGACTANKIRVVRVPAYSPYSVAEHALGLILSLNRKIHRAYQRVRELNFSLEGLVGFDLHGKTVGVIGTGTIGSIFAKNMAGLGCSVVAHDPIVNESLVRLAGVRYVSLAELYAASDIISLHIPLTSENLHIIDAKAIHQMKRGVMLINTGRGALIDTAALLSGLKSEHIGSAGLDVYEEEEGVFFVDHSNGFLRDDILARLITFPNVLVTSHQGFLTKEALRNIAQTTLLNITRFETSMPLEHQLLPESLQAFPRIDAVSANA